MYFNAQDPPLLLRHSPNISLFVIAEFLLLTHIFSKQMSKLQFIFIHIIQKKLFPKILPRISVV